MDRPSGIRDHYDGGIFQYRRCNCGFRTVRYTSWTDDNPGKRFIRCAEIGGKKCWVWEWIDPPMCHHSKQIIPGLLRRLNRLENGNEERNLDNEVLRLLLQHSYTEIADLKARIEDYEVAVSESTKKARNMKLLCIFMFLVLMYNYLS